VELAPGITTPIEVVPGDIEVLTPEPSSSVTPIQLVLGDLEVIDPLPSADVMSAVVIPTEYVRPIGSTNPVLDPPPQTPADDADDNISAPPSDGNHNGPGPSDNVDTTGQNMNTDQNMDNDVNSLPQENTDASALPNAGTGPASGSVPLWPIIAFVAAGFLAGALRLRPAG